MASIEPGQLESLRQQPKNWGLLTVALALLLSSVCVTFLRWYLLVRTLQMPFRVSDAFRLGFLSYLLNFVSFGSVGGDLFKALFIAHEQPGRRAEAVATVVVDRMVGLYALLVVTSFAILLSHIPDPTPALTAICNSTYIATAVGGFCVLVVLTPGFTRGSVSEMLAGLPKIGPTLESLISSIRMYRNKKLVMVSIFLMSMGVHALLATAIYLTASALFVQPPTLFEHLIIVPLSMVAGAIPFTPAGLGTLEFAMGELYQHVPSGGPGDVIGVLVALTYRLGTIVVAGIGVVYYWTSRREVRDITEEVETEEEQAAESLKISAVVAEG